ncbi:MAG: HEAT repeat domain-containing protein [Chloroflexota bacterium]
MSDDPHLQRLFTDLDSANPARRIAALRGLRGRTDERIVPKLTPLLRDSDSAIRVLIAEVLCLTQDKHAVKPLISLLNDEDPEVRLAAEKALYRFGTPEALAALQDFRNRSLDRDEIPEAVFPPPSVSPSSDDTPRGIPKSLIDDFISREEEELPKETEESPSREQLRNAEAEVSAASESAVPVPVQFSAYAPREVMPNVWQPLHAYVYKLAAADAIAADAAEQLGEQRAGYREVARPAQTGIAEGALISAKPELPGFQFNPPSAQIAFYEDWQRFDFKLRAVSAPLDQAANGRITFTVEGVIVADVPLAIYVGASPVPAAPAPPVTRSIYQSIFCSYSHKDTQIIERVEKVYKLLGMNFLRDVVSLKSGQDWDSQLLTLIDQADIFQLFWSSAAAQSPAVRKEWLHALEIQRKQAGFIRPVFWEQPLPALPPELSPIHFAYEPELDQV